jgi:hypothetical protein
MRWLLVALVIALLLRLSPLPAALASLALTENAVDELAGGLACYKIETRGHQPGACPTPQGCCRSVRPAPMKNLTQL